MLGCKQPLRLNLFIKDVRLNFYIRVYLNPLSACLAILEIGATRLCQMLLTLGVCVAWLCRVGILYSVMKTLSGFVEVYSNISSFPELFSPFISLLGALKKDNLLPESLMTLTTEIHQFLVEKVNEHETLRQPLRMRMVKPIAIKTFNPQFEEK